MAAPKTKNNRQFYLSSLRLRSAKLFDFVLDSKKSGKWNYSRWSEEKVSRDDNSL